MQLIDHGGFADAGVPGDEHQLRPAAGNDPIERGEQRIDFTVSPVQLSRGS